MDTYLLTSGIYADESGTHRGFGIAVVIDSNIVQKAEDISTDEKTVAHLVNLCNRMKLSPAHFYDVIDDFIS